MPNQDDERNVMLSVLAGIGIGVMVGAIAGLLLAPRSGTETREAIGEKLHDLGNKLNDLSHDVAGKVKSAVDSGRQAVVERMERAGTDQA